MTVTLAVDGLTKRFGDIAAVDDLSFTVEPGRITGFLGPNGAGKTTTLRSLLGLVAPTSGRATVNGAAYRDLPAPLRTVGAALDSSGAHPGRRAIDHVRLAARAAGVPVSRASELLDMVGLDGAAHRRAGGFSTGMRQRLGLATALAGDPGALVLDEPANGLDPEGIRWLRIFLQRLRGEGRTLLVSSHQLDEIARIADDVVIIAHGRLAFRGPVSDLIGGERSLEDAFLALTTKENIT